MTDDMPASPSTSDNPSQPATSDKSTNNPAQPNPSRSQARNIMASVALGWTEDRVETGLLKVLKEGTELPELLAILNMGPTDDDEDLPLALAEFVCTHATHFQGTNFPVLI